MWLSLNLLSIRPTHASFRLKPEATNVTGGAALGDTIRADSYPGTPMPLLTVRAAAEQLGVAYSTLKRWVHSGQVRTVRTEGGHHRVSDAEIERLLTRRLPDAAPRPQRNDDELLEGLSARNRLRGFVDEVRVDGLLAQIRLRVGDQSLTAVITSDAVRALKLRRGDAAVAVIKSTEVMVARPKSPGPPLRPGRRGRGMR